LNAVRRPLWRVRLRHWMASDAAADFARFTLQFTLCAALILALGASLFLLLALGV
jgi:hypothetical protein